MDDLIARARNLDKAATPGPWSMPSCPDVVESDAGHRVAEICTGNYIDDSKFIAESRALLPALADALEAERNARAQLEQELATARAAHEVTAQERGRATTELAMMRAWVEQAQPVVEALRAWRVPPVKTIALTIPLMTLTLPPKEPT